MFGLGRRKAAKFIKLDQGRFGRFDRSQRASNDLVVGSTAVVVSAHPKQKIFPGTSDALKRFLG
jgi:hypothetical protein